MRKHYGTFKVQNNECWRLNTHFIDVYPSKVIILAVNVILLNKTQEEQNLTSFNAIFGIDFNVVKRLKS